ncbi:hypothetical protein Mal15_09150 [Stieleria maiorica]|uniref:Uncharacterized protein n=1 Tax=Stieleria maiorica TaxID=2795974 RepID=A0A5B9MBH7_9BACT|nr:hypothetical protein [Stieleria maiorica]QEF96885.1 hypothetical protein Mal15_09150 [Stieleria maiorica]
MNSNIASRREIPGLGAATLAMPLLSQLACADGSNDTPQIATNSYPWRTFAKREDRPYARHTVELLDQIAATGIARYEPIVEAPSELDGLGDRLDARGLQMRSIYVNSVLHDEARSPNRLSVVEAHRVSNLNVRKAKA